MHKNMRNVRLTASSAGNYNNYDITLHCKHTVFILISTWVLTYFLDFKSGPCLFKVRRLLMCIIHVVMERQMGEGKSVKIRVIRVFEISYIDVSVYSCFIKGCHSESTVSFKQQVPSCAVSHTRLV